jgi:hypothetical protein
LFKRIQYEKRKSKGFVEDMKEGEVDWFILFIKEVIIDDPESLSTKYQRGETEMEHVGWK